MRTLVTVYRCLLYLWLMRLRNRTLWNGSHATPIGITWSIAGGFVTGRVTSLARADVLCGVWPSAGPRLGAASANVAVGVVGAFRRACHAHCSTVLSWIYTCQIKWDTRSKSHLRNLWIWTCKWGVRCCTWVYPHCVLPTHPIPHQSLLVHSRAGSRHVPTWIHPVESQLLGLLSDTALWSNGNSSDIINSYVVSLPKMF